MKFTVDYPPALNRLYRMVNGHFLISQVGRDYKDTAGWQANAAGANLLEGPVVVSLWLFRPRKAGDIDGTFKVLLDALNGICYIDDSQIVELHAYRHDDKENPRVEIEIEEASQ